MEITRETLISEVVEKAPQAMPAFQAIGMHCMGCAMASGENIEQACCAHGVDPARLIAETEATSTEENLINSFAIIRERGDEPQGRVAVVSSAYHLYRAKLFAQKLGVTDAAGVAAPWGYLFVMLNYFIREAFGVTHFWVFGN